MNALVPRLFGRLTVLWYVVALGTANAQPLPTPHANLDYLGYYYHDSKYGDFRAETNPYTNTSILGPGGVVDTAESDWQTPFAAALSRAAGDGKNIILLVERGTSGNQTFSWGAVLDIAATYWASVKIVGIFDDNVTDDITKEELEDEISDLRSAFSARSLADRPVMANFSVDSNGDINYSDADVFEAAGLDIIAINAYIQDNPFSTTAAAVAFLEDLLDDALTLIDTAGKQAMLVMQGFDRNESTFNIPLLEALKGAGLCRCRKRLKRYWHFDL
jgi:hypothetical protein